MIQRSHRQGCGCASCAGGASSDSQAQRSIQRQTAESDAHANGCGCASCASIQRKADPQQTARSPVKIQRLMTAKAFEKQTWAWGFRNVVKPIDKAVAAYEANSGSMSSEQKIEALQRIIGLCDSYLNDPRRQTSDRRPGVEALKQEAEADIRQLQPVAPEETQSVEPTPEVTQSVEPTPEVTQSVEPTPEVTQSVETAPSEETQSTEPTPEVTQSVDPTLSAPEQMTPVDGGTGEQTQSVETAVDPEKTAANDYLSRLSKNEDIFASGSLKPGETAKSRKEILDLLQNHLSDTEFTQAAALMILNVPASVVEGAKARTVALSHLAILLKDKSIARNLLDKKTAVVVIPKNKKMTDLPQFSSLAGKKTFDGREWENVRGSGGMEINGHIYVAVTEENTLGTDAEGDVSGTDWCYASGYSTTTHEIAHVVDIHGLTAEDRKKVDELYKAKKQKQTAGEVVEWIDGFDYDKPGKNKDEAQAAYNEWALDLPATLTTAGMTDEQERKNTIAWVKYLLVDGGAYADNNYTTWLKHVGVIDGNTIKKKDGTLFANISTISKKVVFGGKQTNYASSHRLEYFAQSANAFFGTNVGTEPYTHDLWDAAGEPEKGTRRNGKSEVGRIEPELKAVFDRIFGSQDITDANPRNQVKKEKEEAAGGTGG